MIKRIKIDDKEVNEVIDLRNQGLTYKQISKIHTNYSERSIRTICDNNKNRIIYKPLKPLSQKTIDRIIDLYVNEFKTYDEIGKILNLKTGKIRDTLIKNNISLRGRGEYTTKEIEVIKKYYPIGDWDNLLKLLPNRNKNSIHKLASKLGIKGFNNDWTKEEIKFLKDNYEKHTVDELSILLDGKHSSSSISTKLGRLGICNKVNVWSKEEEQILKDNYSIISIEEILKLLPNRSKNAIIAKAIKLKLKSNLILNQEYTSNEIDFIKNNYSNLTDKEIAKTLHRSHRSIANKRYEMNLNKFNKDNLRYECLEKYLRGQLSKWKRESMEQCNYQCVLSGSKDFEIHHLYNFSSIFDDMVKIYNIEYKENINDYTKEQLDYITNCFFNIHNKYPLGVCLDKKLHKTFHSIYGKTKNTKDQWDEFAKNYKEKKIKIV